MLDDQWFEITVEDGQTVTKTHPSNEGLIERGQKMMPPAGVCVPRSEAGYRLHR